MPKKTKFEKLWTKEGGSNSKNKFLAKKYFIAALNWAVLNQYSVEKVYEEIKALEE
jgi:hypothetical protein